MVLRDRTLLLVMCGLLAGSHPALAEERRAGVFAPAPKARPAPNRARVQHVNVIDPDRVPPRANHSSQGWRYHRWLIGQVLPPAIWARQFRMDNPSRFGLDRPDDGNAWVRYGPDALLVDLHNGQIVDTVYGFNRNSDSWQH